MLPFSSLWRKSEARLLFPAPSLTQASWSRSSPQQGSATSEGSWQALAAPSQPRLPEQCSAEVLHLFRAANPLIAQQDHGLVAVLLNLLDLLVAERSSPGTQRLGGVPSRHDEGLGGVAGATGHVKGKLFHLWAD